jgi:hypothetical protein
MHWPGRADRYASELSDRTRLSASLGSIRHPRPGQTELVGLSLADPETGELLLDISTLDLWHGPEQLSVVASSAKLVNGGLSPFWELLQGQLKSARIEKTHGLVRQLELAGQTLVDVRIQIEPTELGSQAKLSFQVSGGTAEPVQLRVIRNRQTSPPTTAWELVTGENDLTGPLVAAIFPEATRLGASSRFRGRAWAKQTASSWEGEMAGNLSEVDLESLLGQSFAHQLTGKARVNIEQASFRHGRLVDMGATVLAGPGHVSRSLVFAAVEHLGLTPELNLDALQESEAYGQLGLAFRLDSRGFVMKGICNTPTPDAVLVSPWGIVLKTQVPQQPLQPLANLIALVSPDVGPVLPLTQQSEPLARWLPLSTGTAASPPRTARER